MNVHTVKILHKQVMGILKKNWVNFVNNMKKILIGLVCLILVPCILSKIELQKIYNLQMEIFKDDSVILQDFNLDEGTISTFPQIPKDYSIKILEKKGNVLFKKDIEVSFILNLEPIKSIQLNSTIIHLRLPYFENAEKITINHGNKEIFSIDVSEKICNNNSLCELEENKYNCPGDCLKEKQISWVLFGLIVAILTMGIVFLLKKINLF